MDECPHCGEPIEEDATFCRHCGSDAETGWNPDADYESLELPEDDGDEEEARQEAPAAGPAALRARLRQLLGPALVTAAWLVFLIYGDSSFRPRPLVLVPAVYLAVAIASLPRLASRGPRPPPPQNGFPSRGGPGTT